MYIKVRRSYFHKETLGAMSLEEALEVLKKHPKRNVEEAWKLAGGKRKTKKKAKKKKSEDE